ncbi:MAG: hypothetical protein SWK76_11000 [Actinomycetota bacterium]|nr:hypothetical protein [Actinomycetota bacterium]
MKEISNDESGPIKPVLEESEGMTLKADTFFFTVRQAEDATLLERMDLELDAAGMPVVDAKTR